MDSHVNSDIMVPKPQRTYQNVTTKYCDPESTPPSSEDSRSPYQPPGSPQQPSNSRALKFGMDRILSDDIKPAHKRIPFYPDQPSPPVPPCSECVSSLLRCCRISGPEDYYRSYYASPNHNVLHTPKPVRPYTNLILESDATNHGNMAQSGTMSKRKRSWSRAVFSNLQRKGLEKRFQIQKYITKPDRRQLAATLGLTDAQVKVWFQNRRMKWRHSKEMKFHSGTSFQTTAELQINKSDPSECLPTVSDDRNKV